MNTGPTDRVPAHFICTPLSSGKGGTSPAEATPEQLNWEVPNWSNWSIDQINSGIGTDFYGPFKWCRWVPLWVQHWCWKHQSKTGWSRSRGSLMGTGKAEICWSIVGNSIKQAKRLEINHEWYNPSKKRAIKQSSWQYSEVSTVKICKNHKKHECYDINTC